MSRELEEVARTHPTQFGLWYTLDRPPAGIAPTVPTWVSSSLGPSWGPVSGLVGCL